MGGITERTRWKIIQAFRCSMPKLNAKYRYGRFFMNNKSNSTQFVFFNRGNAFSSFAFDVTCLRRSGTKLRWKEEIFFSKSSVTNSNFANVLRCVWLLQLIKRRNQHEFLLRGQDCCSQKKKNVGR